jgi:hypothetical protein
MMARVFEIHGAAAALRALVYSCVLPAMQHHRGAALMKASAPHDAARHNMNTAES